MVESVVFKGKNEWLEVMLQPDVAFEEVLKALRQRLMDNQSFFAGSNLRVYVAGRKLSQRDKKAVRDCFNKAGSFKALEFESESTVTLLKQPAPEKPGRAENSPDIGPKSIFYKKTLRSGQCITSDGDLCVIGDVNDGAQLIAHGDIVVMGVMRGLAHAGVHGDESACIIALSIQSKQLRIAGHIAASPDGPAQRGNAPEVARIRDGSIIIEEYVSKRGIRTD